MDLQPLLALQEEDGRIRALQEELRVLLPQRKRAAQARLQAARDAVEAATAENIRALRELERLQRDYTRSSSAMNRAERNLAGLTDARAINAAMQEHASASARASAAESAMGDQHLTPTERKLDQARAFEAEEDVAVQAIFDAIAERKATVEAELEKVQALRAQCAAAVPADQLDYYNRLSKTCWPCIVDYNRSTNVCGGCDLRQPPATAQALEKADRDALTFSADCPFVVCPTCGRILK